MELLDAPFERIREQLSSEEPMFVPKPSRSHSRCQVCKIHFEDYLDHISHITHTNKIRESAYNRFIDDFCKEAQKEPNNEGVRPVVVKGPVVVEKKERSLKRQREYLFDESKPTKKCK